MAVLLNGAFEMDYVLIIGEYNRCACVRCVLGVLRLQEVPCVSVRALWNVVLSSSLG